MRYIPTLLLTGLAAASLSFASFSQAADGADKGKKPKPYPLKTCVVTDEEIDDKGDMKPYAFVHEGREVKLCCKSCLKDFKKEPAKYMAKIEAAEKKKAK
jgi:hypothetical protein